MPSSTSTASARSTSTGSGERACLPGDDVVGTTAGAGARAPRTERLGAAATADGSASRRGAGSLAGARRLEGGGARPLHVRDLLREHGARGVDHREDLRLLPRRHGSGVSRRPRRRPVDPSECFVDMRRFAGYELRAYLRQLSTADVEALPAGGAGLPRGRTRSGRSRKRRSPSLAGIVRRDAGVAA